MLKQPVNYNIGVVDPMAEIGKGFQLGTAMREYGEKRKQQALQQAQQLKMMEDLNNLYQNPSPEGALALSAKYPQLEKQMKLSYDHFTEDQKQTQISTSGQILSSLYNQDIDTAKKNVTELKEAAKNGNDAKALRKYTALEKQLETNPNAAITGLELEMSALLGKDFIDYIDNIRKEKDQYRVLTDREKSNLGLDTAKQFQIDNKGKITSIGGGGITVNLGPEGKVGEIGKGYAAYLNPETGRYEQYKMKGGPAELEAKEVSDKEAKRAAMKARGNIFVLDNIDNALKMMDDATFLRPVVGVWSDKILKDFNQKKIDFDSILKTIKGNIGFNKLQEIKEASKTGGALGAVTERELDKLESVLGSLDSNISENLLRNNLEYIKKIINKDAAYRERIKEQIKTNISSDKSIHYKSIHDKSIQDLLREVRERTK